MYPIDIRTTGGDVIDQTGAVRPAFEVWITNGGPTVPATRSGNKVDWDRRSLNLKIKKGYVPPPPVPGIFNKDEAIHIAHSIGHYCLNHGDFVFAYTSVDGRRNESFFNSED